MANVECPYCNAVFNHVERVVAGVPIRCSFCDNQFTVPTSEAPAILEELPAVRRRFRRVSWVLQSVRIRQTARKAFDLTRLGNGSAERLCSALILGAIFFLAALLVCSLAQLQPVYVMGISFLGLVSTMLASSILVLWRSDAELARDRPILASELNRLKDLVIDLKEQQAERWQADLLTSLETKAQMEAEAAAREDARRAEEARRQAEESARPRYCPYCKEVIQRRALKCKHCGEILDEGLREERRPRPQQHWNPGVAAVLSFLWPGLGQIYKGQILNGIVWSMVVMVGYVCCICPGFFLHIFCIFGAASGSD